jgi:DNA processing protein
MLGARLDFRARDTSRFWDLLALADDELIDAIGGRRRPELRAAYRAFEPGASQAAPSVESVCRHQDRYPNALAISALAPHCLHVLGGAGRLKRAMNGAVVAIVGTRTATDYGMEIAHSLAHELLTAGVTVVAELAEGIGGGALGANDGSGTGTAIAVLAGGVERSSPACCAALHRRVTETGCAISELPCGSCPRRWSALARARTIAFAASLLVVVEADDGARELACAHLARALGKPVAALPGRVTSRASRGTSLLIREGATLVRDAQDALDLMYGAGTVPGPTRPARLAPRLQATLDAVGEGRDTLSKLSRAGTAEGSAAVALTELELLGLVVRGDGGRYVACGRGPVVREG